MSWSSFRQALSGKAGGGAAPGHHTAAAADDAAAAAAPLSGSAELAAAMEGRNRSPSGKFEAFDPSALERGVQAIRELNTSPHAERALELSRQQEVTKQLEVKAALERQRSSANEFALKAQAEMAEQRRQLDAQKLEDERKTALYKAKVQAKLEQQQLEERRAYDEQQRAKERAEFLERERVRVANDEAIAERRAALAGERAKLEQETARVKADADADAQIKHELATEALALRRLTSAKDAERRSRLDAIKLHYDNVRDVGASVASAASDPIQMAKGVALVTALSLGFFGARAGASVLGRFAAARLGRPKLVRESSRASWLSPASLLRRVMPRNATTATTTTTATALEHVVLPRYLKARLQWIADATMASTAHKTPFRHMLMHGAPGTGKTLLARALATSSGLDYAVVSGGDLQQLGDAAVTELHALFDWAEASPRGALLFFDEADSFLRSGRDASAAAASAAAAMSESGRHVVSAFLQRTGTESTRFMLVLASNLPVASFDRAVRDRIDEVVEFPMPGVAERREMLQRFFAKYLVRPGSSRWFGLQRTADAALHSFVEQDYAELAHRTAGFSGRQLAKFVISLRAAVYGGLADQVTPAIAEQLLDWKEWETAEDAAAADADDDDGADVQPDQRDAAQPEERDASAAADDVQPDQRDAAQHEERDASAADVRQGRGTARKHRVADAL